MKICSCSERPLGIIDSKVIMKENTPYQVLYFGCTNKKCAKYKQVTVEKYINLLDNSDVYEIEV